MFRLTKNTDYALMVIRFMSAQKGGVGAGVGDGGVANTKMMAETHRIPLELLAKILQMLSKSGILISKGGPKGGYLLAREANAITLAEVIEAVEGPIHIIRCEDEDCAQIACCTVREPLTRIEGHIVAYLASTTVAQLCQETFQPEAVTQGV